MITALFLMLFAASFASAQEKGQVGLGMGYPGSVLLLWHVTDNIAVRPEIAFSTSGTDTGSVTGSGWSYGVGVSGLLYAGKWESLRTYVSPRFTYNRSSSTTTTNLLSPNVIGLPPPSVSFSSSTKSTATNKRGGGSFGAQYAVHKRFSVFGEVGLDYSRGESSFTSTFSPAVAALPSTTTTGSSSGWSSRSAAGVIFYF